MSGFISLFLLLGNQLLNILMKTESSFQSVLKVTHILQSPRSHVALPTKSQQCHCAFVFAFGCSHNDNLWCHRWRHGCETDDGLFSAIVILNILFLYVHIVSGCYKWFIYFRVVLSYLMFYDMRDLLCFNVALQLIGSLLIIILSIKTWHFLLKHHKYRGGVVCRASVWYTSGNVTNFTYYMCANLMFEGV